MRRLFVILSLFVAIVAMAGPVDKKQAMQEAAAFLKNHPLTVDNKADGQAQAAEAVRLTDVSATLPMGEKAPFYIINIGDQQGFVIVSGDDRTQTLSSAIATRGRSMQTVCLRTCATGSTAMPSNSMCLQRWTTHRPLVFCVLRDATG